MDFVNNQVESQALPHFETLDWESLHKEYKGYLMVKGVINFLIFLGIGMLIFILLPNQLPTYMPWTALITFIILGSIGLLTANVRYRNYGFAVRDHDISMKNGWLFKNQTTMPINRVQHHEITQSFFERQFELVTLDIYNASRSSGNLSIPGLTRERAESIQTYINHKLRTTENHREEE